MDDPVAIVGAAALLPGSPGLADFWRTVVSGRDLMTDVPASRWLIEDHYDPDPRAVDKTYGRRGAFLPAIDFDPLRYGIPPNNLPAIDTSQLLALVVAERVLADCSGRPVDPERVGVVVGASGLERMVEASARLQRPVWLRAMREHGVADELAQAICDRIAAQYVPWQEETFPGLLTNVVAGRIANRFDLHGVNHTTDAACASSLAALYAGVAELTLGRSDMVVVGGVDTMTDITMYACFTRTPALSPTGDCRPFAADADGTMLGEGLVLFAIKRLADAERDGDRVYAVIRGIGASSDGRGTAIFAPVPEGQARALRRAYEAAGYGPETVELVEAHGTGTSAGDIAEFTALREVFGASGGTARQWCALGSVKSQIGHTKSAAGAAGLLKAILALHHKVLPPTIKVDRPHPALDIGNSPFYLNTGARPWIRAAGAHPRRASVSSFGFGGTNFHVTVEEAASAPARLPVAPTELVLLGSGSVAELRSTVDSLNFDAGLAELARRTQAEFEPTAEVRLAVVAAHGGDLAGTLADAIRGGHYATGTPPTGRLAFLFPGQGAQYVGMGGDLATHLDRARVAWDRAARLDFGDRPLHRVVFPPQAFTDAERLAQESRLTATEWSQPALAVHSLSLLGVLDAIGVTADVVAGHSFGELVALHAAGAYDADTLVRLARRRGELMARSSVIEASPKSLEQRGERPDHGRPGDGAAVRGGMLVVAADRDTVAAAIAGQADVWLANHNGPRQVVLAGTLSALDAVAARFAGEGIGRTRLNVAAAFHSPLVAPAREPLLAYLRGVDVSAPKLPVIGTAGGREYPAEPEAIRERLAAQLAEPVAFVDMIEAMYASGVRTFVEVGAGATLTGLVGVILGDRPHAAIPLDRRGQNGLTSLQEGLGRLAVHGVRMNLDALWAETSRSTVDPSPLSRSAVRLDGGNYARPYPPSTPSPATYPSATYSPPTFPAATDPAATPPSPPSAPTASPGGPAVIDASPKSLEQLGGRHDHGEGAIPVDAGWLRVIGDAQRQLAEAHETFQRTMTESHTAYLKMAETTLAGLLAAATGRPSAATGEPPAVMGEFSAATGEPSAATGERPAPVGESDVKVDLEELRLRSSPNSSRSTSADVPVPETVVPVADVLLAVVAERTGYPVEVLNVDMALDTDLGIDSIKKVEILSAVRDRVGDAPSGELSSLATLRTLREIADRFTPAPATPTSPTPAPAAPTAPTSAPAALTPPAPTPPTPAPTPVIEASPKSLEVLGGRPDHGGGGVVRRALRVVGATASGRPMPGLDGRLAVTDDGGGVAGLVVAGLARHGVAAEVVSRVPADAGGVIVLDGLRAAGSVDAAVEAQRAAFRAARAVAARMEATGGVFVTVQDTGGDFGLATPPDPARAWLGGLAALARTAAKEWPLAAVKAIDCATAGRPAQAVADAIVAELTGGAGAAEVGLRADGARVVPDLRDAPIAEAGSRIGPHSVIVATGGARGVTAAALRLLAGRHRPRLLLLGRTPLTPEAEAGIPSAGSADAGAGSADASIPGASGTDAGILYADGAEAEASNADEAALIRMLARSRPGTPAELAARAREVLAAREIRRNLAAFARDGVPARYMSVDVRSAEAVRRALDAVRPDWGPVTAVVHGAGVLADARIRDKTDEQFARVFDTKVGGLRALLAATAGEPLELLCAFSSVAAVFGNPGQADYAMANEVLGQVLAAERARRPDCLVRAIAWGPWRGGMVTPELAGRFRAGGVPLIEPEAGARAFAAELAGPADGVLAILAA